MFARTRLNVTFIRTYIARFVYITGKAMVTSALIQAKLTHCMTISPNLFQNYEYIAQQVFLGKASE